LIITLKLFDMSLRYTLDQLQTFVAVAETGSFSAAGRALNRVQSAISYTVGQLELAIDAELFDRDGRRPRLTKAGERLLHEARLVLTQARALAECAHSLSGGDEAELRVIVDALYPTNLLYDALAAMAQRFPHTLVRLSSGLMNDVAEAVLSGHAELGICNFTGESVGELQAHYLGTVALAPVCAASHPLARSSEHTPTALLEQYIQVVHTERDAAGSADQGVIAPRTWRVTDLGAKTNLIRRGVGWGSLPLGLVAPDIAASTLVRLHPQVWSPDGHHLPMHAITRNGATRGRALAWLCKHLGAEDARLRT